MSPFRGCRGGLVESKSRETGKPSVGDDGDEVVRWNGFEHWKGGSDASARLSAVLSKDGCVAEEMVSDSAPA